MTLKKGGCIHQYWRNQIDNQLLVCSLIRDLDIIIWDLFEIWDLYFVIYFGACAF